MTPTRITLTDELGTEIETPIKQDGTGWYAKHGDTLFHVSAVNCRPRAATPSHARWEKAVQPTGGLELRA